MSALTVCTVQCVRVAIWHSVQAPIAPHPPVTNPQHPPAWDTHLFGPAHGDFNHKPSQRRLSPKSKLKALHAGNGALFPLHNHAAKTAAPTPYEQRSANDAADVSNLEQVCCSLHC